jgi:glucosylglycerate phosphorylase
LENELADQDSLRSQVFARYRNLLAMRNKSAAFHPHGGQKVLDLGPGVFAVLRSSPDDNERVLCLQNITAQTQSVAGYNLDAYQTRWLEHP